MSGAVPNASPATSGEIYEATAKAETVYADAERLARLEFTELQKMAAPENEANLTMVMGRSVSDSKPTSDNLLYSLNTDAEIKVNTSHALEEAYEDLFSAEEIENHKSLTPVQLAERTLLRRRDMVFSIMSNFMAEEVLRRMNRVKDTGSATITNVLTVMRTRVGALGNQLNTMADAHDELEELRQAFVDSQVEVLPLSVTRTHSIDKFVTDLDAYMIKLNDTAKAQDNVILRSHQYSVLLETETSVRPHDYDDQIKECERQHDHAKVMLKQRHTVLVGGSTNISIIGVLVGQVWASVWSHQRLVMSVVVTRAYRATFGILPLNIGSCRWAK